AEAVGYSFHADLNERDRVGIQSTRKAGVGQVRTSVCIIRVEHQCTGGTGDDLIRIETDDVGQHPKSTRLQEKQIARHQSGGIEKTIRQGVRQTAWSGVLL